MTTNFKVLPSGAVDMTPLQRSIPPSTSPLGAASGGDKYSDGYRDAIEAVILALYRDRARAHRQGNHRGARRIRKQHLTVEVPMTHDQAADTFVRKLRYLGRRKPLTDRDDPLNVREIEMLLEQRWGKGITLADVSEQLYACATFHPYSGRRV